MTCRKGADYITALVRHHGLDAPRGAEQQYVRRPVRKQAVGDDADDGVDLCFHFQWRCYGEIIDVENHVAVVCHNPVTVHRIAPQLYQLAGDMTARHGNDLDREGEVPQGMDQLGFITDTDKALGNRRHDLLTGQGRPAALDELQGAIGFIGAIDVNVDTVDGIEVIDGNAVAFEALGRGFRAGNRGIDLRANTRQGVDEIVGR